MKRRDAAGTAPAQRPLCLTLDVESDYGRTESFAILDRAAAFFDWIRDERVPLTAFVTGRLIARGHPILDRLVACGAALELHGHAHDPAHFGTMFDSHAEEIEQGTAAYQRRFSRLPSGYRAPSGIVGADDLQRLARLGYRYDASIFPVRRPGRYDFTPLPHSPFRWQGLGLVEFPVSLLNARVPAGLTFINVLGPGLSASLIRRAAPAAGPVVLDGHFHNLFTDRQAMAGLPLGLRAVYTAGRWSGGLACTQALVRRLRRHGYEPADLRTLAEATPAATLPEVGLDVFRPRA